MKVSPLLAMAAIAFLAGCDRDTPDLVPPGGPDDFLRAADVLVAAQCELDRAAAARAGPLKVARAEIAMTLTVRVSESTGGGISLTIPIASTDLTLRRDRVPEGAAFRKMDFRITHDIGSAPDCPSEALPTAPGGARFIKGGLGLTEWMTETAILSRQSGQVPYEVHYAMSFDVSVSDDRSPVFTRPFDDIDGSFTRQDANAREVRHRIAVTIAPGATGRAGDGKRRAAADRFLERIDR